MGHMDVEQLTLEIWVLPNMLTLEASTMNCQNTECSGRTRWAVEFENPETERTKDKHTLVN